MGIFESEDYAPDATPVEDSEVAQVHEAVSDMMQDSLMHTNTGNLASNAETEFAPTEESEGLPQGDASGLETFIDAHSEDYRDVSSFSLADYQEWLFEAEDVSSELAVARIVSNFKASGYDVKPSYATIAASTWSRANYAGEERADTLHKVERASVAELQPYVIEIESEGLDSLVDIVRKAEANATDYKAEMLSELRAEYEAESKTIFNKYTKPVAIAAASLLGLGVLWRMK